MVVSPALEKLILCGKAEYKTFGGRFSSNYKMKIPNGCTVIVTNIIWNNFLQTFEENDPTIQEYFNNNAYQLRFYDTNRTYNHIHLRNHLLFSSANNNNWTATNTMSSILARAAVLPGPPIQIECYFVHKKYLEINLIKHEKADLFTFNFGQIDQAGEIDRPPIDTGGPGGLNTVKYARNNITDTVENYPQSLDFTTAPVPASNLYGNDYIQLNNQRYQMNNPAVYPANMKESSTPLFTVGYVLIRDENVFSTLADEN